MAAPISGYFRFRLLDFGDLIFHLYEYRLFQQHHARAVYRHAMRYSSTSSSSNLLTLLDRGVFQNVFPSEKMAELKNRLIGSPQCLYCGFDPTADSLHVGNLLAIMALLHGQRAGHHVIAVLGGATGRIGDPSGRSSERVKMKTEQMDHNIASIKDSLHRIFTNHNALFWRGEKQMQPAKILNNAEWYEGINIIHFLSTVGRCFRMADLLGRASVQSRLRSPEGMSLTEFSYQVFQAYDWLHLYNTYNCSIQVGGNDQMGNITSGHDLISKVKKKTAFGLTVPLVKSTTGDKLGKTAGNAVWLNPNRTSPFELYQYFFNFADSDVDMFLKLFTFLPDTEIADIMKQHKHNPAERKAQKKLAENVTLLVHGEAGLGSARRCTAVLFNKSSDALVAMDEGELRELFSNTPICETLLDPGTTLRDAVLKAGCFRREEDADRVIRAGGVWVNHQRQTEPDAVLTPGQHILSNKITLIRVGKKNYYLIKWLP